MRVAIDLDPAIALALRQFANEIEEDLLSDAAKLALHDWLISRGYLAPERALAKDTDTKGNA